MYTSVDQQGRTPAEQADRTRWIQLIVGVICMVATANIQYAWTLFVPEIQATYGWTRASIQAAFTIFVVVQTWLTPIEGYFIDKYGPRVMVAIGGVLTGLAWVINSYATDLTGFYIGAAIGGMGVGCVYSTCINNALKWFPHRRGLAVGLTAGGYGAGSALTILPIASMIASSGFQSAFFFFGVLQGTVIFAVAWFLRSPQKEEVRHSDKVAQSRRDYTLGEALRTPVFWTMMAMFILTVTGGLMAVAQLGVIAQDLGVKEFQVNLYFFAMAALPFALMLDRVMNGISRPLFGWISDRIGREKTMFIAFAMEAVGILALAKWGHNPMAFVFLTGMVFFAWGEIFSLFPATCGDTFGSKYAASNAGLLYTAKGTAALLVPISSVIADATGSWDMVFVLASAVNALAAVMALFVLKPMRARVMEANSAETAMPSRPAVTLAE